MSTNTQETVFSRTTASRDFVFDDTFSLFSQETVDWCNRPCTCDDYYTSRSSTNVNARDRDSPLTKDGEPSPILISSSDEDSVQSFDSDRKPFSYPPANDEPILISSSDESDKNLFSSPPPRIRRRMVSRKVRVDSSKRYRSSSSSPPCPLRDTLPLVSDSEEDSLPSLTSPPPPQEDYFSQPAQRLSFPNSPIEALTDEDIMFMATNDQLSQRQNPTPATSTGSPPLNRYGDLQPSQIRGRFRRMSEEDETSTDEDTFVRKYYFGE